MIPPIFLSRRGPRWPSYLLFSLLLCVSATSNDFTRRKEEAIGAQQILSHHDHPNPYPQAAQTSSKLRNNDSKPLDTLPAMLDALDVMQEDYFEVWQGIWPTSIDWTSAVIGTHVSAALSTFSSALNYKISSSLALSSKAKIHENTINRYFSQLVASYFGQNAFGLRGQAYDDMLWVVLGWLESIKFINLHSELHYPEPGLNPREGGEYLSWYGKQWIPSFAHRARIFWELASQGWDTTLCDGGMIWSPYLVPYKNAITNELFITASISMYLYFPGDDNTSPFGLLDSPSQPGKAHDPKYLVAAVNAYKWLIDSNMTDQYGLYIDGFHVSGWSRGESNGSKKCDIRNEMVFTYNQGVLLSGQRGLWEATGARSYLEEGHNLVASVINATGYDLKHDKVFNDSDYYSKPHLGKWYGLGRSGILEDACDAGAQCSQDSQTFKGIFFHHFTLFCAPLPDHLRLPEEPAITEIVDTLKSWHDTKCASYSKWVSRNAEAAKGTANREGRYGAWWGAPKDVKSDEMDIPTQELRPGAIDYRSFGVPKDKVWRDLAPREDETDSIHSKGIGSDTLDSVKQIATSGKENASARTKDLNDRGKGRTVETQGGGIAVLRAAWELPLTVFFLVFYRTTFIVDSAKLLTLSSIAFSTFIKPLDIKGSCSCLSSSNPQATPKIIEKLLDEIQHNRTQLRGFDAITTTTPTKSDDSDDKIPGSDVPVERTDDSESSERVSNFDDTEASDTDTVFTIANSDSESSKMPRPAHLELIPHLTQLAKKLTNEDNVKAPSIANPIPTSPVPTQDIQTFHLFPRLPAEIRIKIWALNLPRPHILHVSYHHRPFIVEVLSHQLVPHPVPYIWHEPDPGPYLNQVWSIKNKLENPFANLHICQESRFEALKSRFFEGFELIHLYDDNREKTWFNFKTDTYFWNTLTPKLDTLTRRQYNPPSCKSVKKKLRFLAISALPRKGGFVSLKFEPYHQYYFNNIQWHMQFQNGALQFLKSVEKISISTDYIIGETDFRFVEAGIDLESKYERIKEDYVEEVKEGVEVEVVKIKKN